MTRTPSNDPANEDVKNAVDRPVDSPIEAQLAAPPVSYAEPASTMVPVSSDQHQSTMFADMIQSKVAVLSTLCLMTGALGLPLLWMNRQFTDRERLFWAVVVTIYTTILIGIVVWICLWAYNRIMGV